MEQWFKIRRVLWGSWYFLCALLVIWLPMFGTPILMTSVFVMWNGQRKRYERVEDFWKKYGGLFWLCCIYHMFREPVTGFAFVIIGIIMGIVFKEK